MHRHTIPIKDLGLGEPDWKLELIILESPNENIIQRFQARLAGKYFCYRHQDETRINFVSLDDQEQKYKSYIDLSPMIEVNDRFIKYVTFDGIKKDSYLRYKEQQSLKRSTEKEKGCDSKSHLLCVTITNTNYVFDLDAHIVKNKRLLETTLQN